jgi:hypothetical protein
MCTFDSSRNEIKTYDTADCVKKMITDMYNKSVEGLGEMKENTDMKLIKEDKYDFENSTCCSICKHPFEEGDIRCRDHDHRTGKYRWATHQKCNINYFCNRYVPVVFHILRGYDSHFIIKQAHEILSEINNPKIDAIPNSYEKFMSFNIGCLRFIDGLQFMASSLNTLVQNLYEKEDKYKNFNNMKRFYFDEKLDLLCRKDYYPYEWVDSDEKLSHVGLPERDNFYSSLIKEGIREDS